MSRQMTKLMPWVGGKAQLMWAIQMLLPTHYKTLVDVFGGSGIMTMPYKEADMPSASCSSSMGSPTRKR